MCLIMDTNSFFDVIYENTGNRRGVSVLYDQKHYIKISLRYNKCPIHTNK